MLCPTVRSSHCLHNFGISKAAAAAAATADRCMNNRNSSIKHVESKAALEIASACCCCFSHGTRSCVRQVAAIWGAAGGYWCCPLPVVICISFRLSQALWNAGGCVPLQPPASSAACPPRSRNFQSVPIVARSVTSFIDPRQQEQSLLPPGEWQMRGTSSQVSALACRPCKI